MLNPGGPPHKPLFGTLALHLLMSSVGTIVVELIDSDLVRRLDGRKDVQGGLTDL